MDKIKRVLFICLGNTARSPAAEYLARHYIEKYELDIKVESAGFINAFSYMQRESQDYLNSKGIKHSDFKPQLITRKLLQAQDLILTMERSHVQDILSSYGDIQNIEKILYTLKEFNGDEVNLDIIDPYYTSRKTYDKIMKIINENIEKAMKKIKELNK